MSEERKKSIQAALEKYLKRDLKEINKLQGRGKKNMKPEKEVEKACLIWMRAQGWEVSIYESKAIFNARSGTYTANPGLKTGNADCQGIMPCGTSVAVEFKAPGKINTFLRDGNEAQRDFIIKRIHMNGFAVVVDSVECLEKMYGEWKKFREVDPECARRFLLSSLPTRKK